MDFQSESKYFFHEESAVLKLFFFLFLPPIVIIQELYSLIHIYINYASFPTHMTISIVVICCMASSLVLRDKERAIISVTPTLGRGFVCSGVTSLLPDPE